MACRVNRVKIRLVFKNISDREIPYVRGIGTGVEPHGVFVTDVEVRNAKGEPMQKTEYHRLLRGKDDTSAKPATLERSAAAQTTSRASEPRPRIRASCIGYMLKPGESREEDIGVSNLYDLS